jgi:hypothetical protein
MKKGSTMNKFPKFTPLTLSVWGRCPAGNAPVKSAARVKRVERRFIAWMLMVEEEEGIE